MESYKVCYAEYNSLWSSPAPDFYTVGFVMEFDEDKVCTVLNEQTVDITGNEETTRTFAQVTGAAIPTFGLDTVALDTTTFNLNVDSFSSVPNFVRDWCGYNKNAYDITTTDIPL